MFEMFSPLSDAPTHKVVEEGNERIIEISATSCGYRMSDRQIEEMEAPRPRYAT
jgi:hypothetical protein